MKRSERIELETKAIARALETYPTLLLQGQAQTCLARVISAAIRVHNLPSADITMFNADQHPDVLILDGRDTKPDEARAVRDSVSATPSRLPKRYLIISRMDRLHNNAAQSLLKLIEEPPLHLRVILTTDRPWAIIPTIHSRSILYEVENPSAAELEEELKTLGLDEPAWRASICGGVSDAARELDVKTTKEWSKIWLSCLGGSRPNPEIPFIWTEKFSDANNSTLLACWSILISIAARRPSSGLWREIAITCIKERERCIQGRSNKIRTSTTLTHIYAYVKTAVKRRA